MYITIYPLRKNWLCSFEIPLGMLLALRITRYEKDQVGQNKYKKQGKVTKERFDEQEICILTKFDNDQETKQNT